MDDSISAEKAYRLEANALTLLAFRHSSLEDLHHGRHHPALDAPGVSRITQDEMKQLMIETSSQLADLLKLKLRDPDAYWKKIEYGLRITRTYNWEV